MDSSHGELMPRALVSCDLSKHGEFGASANIMANCLDGFLISSLLGTDSPAATAGLDVVRHMHNM